MADIDREKVIKALKHCKDNQHVNDCDTCDYGGKTGMFCIRMIDDILALLKEHETEIIGIRAENRRIFSENIRLNRLLKEKEAVVRCKDCKYAYLTDDGECKYCEMEKDDNGSLIELYRSWDWYCADGERK